MPWPPAPGQSLRKNAKKTGLFNQVLICNRNLREPAKPRCNQLGLTLSRHREDASGIRAWMGLKQYAKHILSPLEAGLERLGPAWATLAMSGMVVLAGAAQPDGGYLLTVRDNGIGMTESEVANALIPFGQNHAKMAVRHEGTGLGLPLAKAMMELHGGSLTVESRRDHGTCVSLVFPASCIAPAQQAAA